MIVKKGFQYFKDYIARKYIDMKAVNYYMSNNKIKFDVLTSMLRIPYLLMDSVSACGDTGQHVYSVEMLQKASTRAKILILENFYEHLKFIEPLELIRKIKKAYKEESNVKHQERKVFIAYNKMLHSIDPLYEGYIKWLLDNLKKNGIVELKGIIEDNIFTLPEVVNNHEKNFKKNVSKLSPYLLLKGIMANPEEEPRIFSIANDLVNSVFVNDKKVYRYSDPEATDENEVYLYKCLTIPEPSSLLANELKTVRKNLRESTIGFNNALRDWSYFFYANQPAELKIEWFVSEVITLLPSIQTAIDNDSILRYLKTTNKENEINVWIGEAPLPVVWDYYKYYGIIDDECYRELQLLLETNAELKNRIPIMVIETGNIQETTDGLLEESALKEEDHEFSARKFISI